MTIDSLQARLADRYTIERELGSGGMATVYLAQDLKHHRQVAIKVMREELSAAIGADRFTREIELVARLQHPNVLPLIDSHQDGAFLCYVTPYIRGETLRDLLDRDGQLTVDRAVSLAIEIADALAYSHREGVVHRDIKPENILLQEGHAIVADFGVARAFAAAGGSTMTQAGFAVGTPTYMSPEQATGSSSIDGKSDVYAIGCLLFEMLTGRPPFTGSNLQQVAAAHVTTPAPPIATIRADIPPRLAALIGDCLAKDPDERPTAATLVERLRGSTIAAFAKPKRTGQMAMLAAVVVLGAVGIWWWFIRDSGSESSVAAGAERIAVMPLSAVSDTSLSRLGQDLVVTLSTTLDGVGELRTVDAATLLLNTRDAPSPLPLVQAQEIARRLGAGSVLTGTLIGEGSNVRASVKLYPVGSDNAMATASAVVPVGDIAALTDSLTWRVLRQVWRRGEAPSPVLSGLTTGSFDALRAFLDGERLFQQLAVDSAIKLFHRAFDLDSNFVQAYLRYDAARTWSLQSVDQPAHQRLLALASKLPERERLWLEATESDAPLPEQAARWQELIDRYPDYPPILMSGVDGTIHNGPVYGIDLASTLPVLERLTKLTPDNADVWFHRGFVGEDVGDPHQAIEAFRKGAALSSGVFARLMAFEAASEESAVGGNPPIDSLGMAFARALSALRTDDQVIAWSGVLGLNLYRIPDRLALLERVRRDGIYTGELLNQSYLGEGTLRIARGDWRGGLAALKRNESSSVPVANRFSTARLATIGTWLGTVDSAVARAAVERARSFPGADELERDRIELDWFDGLLAVVEGDAAGVRQAIARLGRERGARSVHVARSLGALWDLKNGKPGAADTIRAISDAAMRDGNFGFAAEVVNRFVIARSLRSQGKSAEVERYLMWIDAGLNTPRTFPVKFSLTPTVQFERGMALEEAGAHDAAVTQLKRFLAAFDSPSPGQENLIAEARRVVAGRSESETAPSGREN